MPKSRSEQRDERLREIPLIERLKRSQAMIGEMCRLRRCPKMTIPVAWDDEDVFISTTIGDAIEQLKRVAVELLEGDMVLDWQGRPVVVEETDETEIYVWEITPHPQTNDYDSILIRGYQKAREMADLAMERVMDENEREDLIEGVKVEVKLIKTTIGYMKEIDEN
jgi:hypothetical protein